MTYVEIVEDGVSETKYVPDHCECGAFLTKDGECNKCGGWLCKNCGQMMPEPDGCYYCKPENALEYIKQQIKDCQQDEEVKSCSKCLVNQSCWMLDEKHDLEQEIKWRKK